eukprot:g148.t1
MKLNKIVKVGDDERPSDFRRYVAVCTASVIIWSLVQDNLIRVLSLWVAVTVIIPRMHPKSKETETKNAESKPMEALMMFLIIGPQVLMYLLAPDMWKAGSKTVTAALETFTFDSAQKWLTNPTFLLSCAILIPERLMYSYVWVFGKQYKAWWNAHPFLRKYVGTCVDGVLQTFYLFKFLQFFAYANIIWSAGLTTRDCFVNSGLWPLVIPGTDIENGWRQITGLQLLLLGQAMNIGIYRAIGKNGVYYGARLGYKVPWSTSFPFNVYWAHPQYIGAMMTVVGGSILCFHPEAQAMVNSGFFALSLWMGVLYMAMGWVEEYC